MASQLECLRFKPVFMSPMERAARELCRLDGMAPNVNYDGLPMWQSYLPEVKAVLEALWDGADDDERPTIERWMASL